MYKKVLHCIVLIILLFILCACRNGTATININTEKSNDSSISMDFSEQAGVDKDSQIKNNQVNSGDISVVSDNNLTDSDLSHSDSNHSTVSKSKLSNLEIIINDQTENSTGTFNLGMTKKEVKALLKSRNMKIEFEDDNGSAGSIVISDCIRFHFDINQVLYEMYAYKTQNFQTSKGLKSGDSIQRLKDLYGKDYYSHEEPDAIVYEYKFPTGVFFVVFNLENKVEGWGVSTESFTDKNPGAGLNKSDNSETLPESVKNQLLSEFRTLIKKVQSGDKSEYNMILASDRANGLNSMFTLSEEENTFVKENYTEIRSQLKHSLVYTGYSEDGVHFIAIISPFSLENRSYKEAVNKIRNKDDEFDFLSYITDVSPERSLYLGVDICAEHITAKKEDIKLDGITLSNSGGDKLERPIFDKEVSKILSKYNRTTTEKFIFKNKNWYTFVFDGTLIYQPEITIHYNGKKVILQK